MNFQDMVLRLQSYWSEKGCILVQSYNSEKGAGTLNPNTFLPAKIGRASCRERV